MSAKKWDIVATIEYSKSDGSTAKRYVNCGAAFEGSKGVSLKIDSMPVGPGWNGWLSLYEPRERNGQGERSSERSAARPSQPTRREQQGGGSRAPGDFDDDVPFLLNECMYDTPPKLARRLRR